MINGITGLGYGFDNYMMNSNQDADAVINTFREFIKQGYHPEEIEQEVYRRTGVNPMNLTSWDKQRIQRKVEEIYQATWRN